LNVMLSVIIDSNEKNDDTEMTSHIIMQVQV
jgi:hypothetical protein